MLQTALQAGGPVAGQVTTVDEGSRPTVRKDLDWTQLQIGAEEGFVLSRLDGHTRVADLAAMTGLPASRVQEILQLLVAHGAVEVPLAAAQTVAAVRQAPAATARDLEAASPNEPMPSPTDEPGAQEEDSEDTDTEESRTERERDNANHRALFEKELRHLDPDVRASMAQTQTGNMLCALCLDPVPAVIAAVMDNPAVGLPHARLVAAHHKNPRGLEALARKSAFLAHRDVQRLLLRNDQLPDAMLLRICNQRRLVEVFKFNTDKNLPERTRTRARHAFRQKWQSSGGDERAEVIFKTEGRVLAMLTGLTMDGQTAQQLTSRQIHSPMLVQNLARFPATLPPVLAHLLKQPVCKRQPQLRAMVLQHPNVPSDIKRRGGA